MKHEKEKQELRIQLEKRREEKIVEVDKSTKGEDLNKIKEELKAYVVELKGKSVDQTECKTIKDKKLKRIKQEIKVDIDDISW